MNKGSYKNLTKVKLGNLELETNHKSKEIFLLERSKDGRKKQLKQFITSKLKERWMTIPSTIAIMEKKFLQDLIDSI